MNKRHICRMLLGIGLATMLPFAVLAQTFDRQELIKELTQQVAKLQAQLDALRQIPSPTPTPNALEQQITAQSGEFLKRLNGDLYIGIRSSPDVSDLQQFLKDQGLYTGPITGNFFNLTKDAVKKFQTNHGLDATGYFGPLTRAATNGILKNATPNEKFYLVPSSMQLAIGQVAPIKAYYQLPMPPCSSGTGCIQVMPPPQEVHASFSSDNPKVAAIDGDETNKTCAPPRMCPVGINQYVIRGVSGGNAVITATFYTDVAGTFTAVMNVAVGNVNRSAGSLSLDPPSATLAPGETVKVKAIFTPPRPACLDAKPACEIAERAPYEVDVALVSSNPLVAASTCPPESGRLTCIGSNGARGVSPGTAVMTASYTNESTTLSAQMAVTVTGAPTTTGSLYIQPSSASLKIGERVSVQALFQASCPTGLACIQSLQNVDGSFISNDPLIAVVHVVIPDCAPLGASSACSSLPLYFVHGVSAGKTAITASYTKGTATLTAVMNVVVAAK